VWTVEVMTENDISLWSSLPYWLRDGISEYLARETPFSDFQKLIKEKKPFSIKELEKSFFQHDQSRTDKNICYQGCRWFIDYVTQKVGGLDVILEAVQEAKEKGVDVYQAFSEKTGFDFFELEKEWWKELKI